MIIEILNMTSKFLVFDQIKIKLKFYMVWIEFRVQKNAKSVKRVENVISEKVEEFIGISLKLTSNS